jgi:hypothetical protein
MVTGMDYLRNPRLFKGMGFSLEERQALGKSVIYNLWTRVNQHDRFPLNVGRFPLPTCWLYPQTHKWGAGKQKSADVKRKMVTLIYPDPKPLINLFSNNILSFELSGRGGFSCAFLDISFVYLFLSTRRKFSLPVGQKLTKQNKKSHNFKNVFNGCHAGS